MTTLDSSSSPSESGNTSMGDSSQPFCRPHHRQEKKKRKEGDLGLYNDEEDAEEEDADGKDAEEGDRGRNEMQHNLWLTFRRSFRQVQTVLDQNRVLINQVNENHQSKIPDNLTKNVALIREINSNVSKVASLYSDLSSNFTHLFHRHGRQSSSPSGDCVNSSKST